MKDSRPPRYTPWDAIQTSKKIADGIWWISTASHGGYWLDEDREQQRAKLFKFECWAGTQWYEEDEDWCAVVLAFPEYFTDEQVYYAVRMAYHSLHDEHGWWTALRKYCEKTGLKARHDQFAVSIAHKWEVCGGGTSGKGWSIALRRGEERRTIKTKDYPTKNLYTDEELSALTSV